MIADHERGKRADEKDSREKQKESRDMRGGGGSTHRKNGGRWENKEERKTKTISFEKC